MSAGMFSPAVDAAVDAAVDTAVKKMRTASVTMSGIHKIANFKLGKDAQADLTSHPPTTDAVWCTESGMVMFDLCHCVDAHMEFWEDVRDYYTLTLSAEQYHAVTDAVINGLEAAREASLLYYAALNERRPKDERRRPWGNDNSPPAPPRPYSTRSRKETATYVSYLRRDLRAMRRCFDYEYDPHTEAGGLRVATMTLLHASESATDSVVRAVATGRARLAVSGLQIARAGGALAGALAMR